MQVNLKFLLLSEFYVILIHIILLSVCLPPQENRIALLPSDDSENTCPNSPRKIAPKEEPVVSAVKASPAKLHATTTASPISPASTPKNEGKKKKVPSVQKTIGSHQKTLTSFFKISPPAQSQMSFAAGNSAISPSSSTPAALSSSSSAAGKSSKVTSASASRKKLIELVSYDYKY